MYDSESFEEKLAYRLYKSGIERGPVEIQWIIEAVAGDCADFVADTQSIITARLRKELIGSTTIALIDEITEDVYLQVFCGAERKVRPLPLFEWAAQNN